MKPITSAILPTPVNPQLLGDIRSLIAQSRVQLAAVVNSVLTLLYWHIGQFWKTYGSALRQAQGERFFLSM